MTTSVTHMNLKCSLAESQIEDRLKHHPEILELQLFERDLDNPEHIIEVIRRLQAEGVRVFLHHPPKVGDKYLDILSEDTKVADFYTFSCRMLADICEQEGVHCVVHPHYDRCPSGEFPTVEGERLQEACEEVAVRIDSIRTQLTDRFLWENSPNGLFSVQNPRWITDIVAPSRVPLCYDISHAFMGLRGSNEALMKSLASAMPYIHYFHVVDSIGTAVHDALPIGRGTIDWKTLKQQIIERDFIFEIGLKDHEDCTEMVTSAEYFDEI